MICKPLPSVLILFACVISTGCSSLGLSLFPTGHFLTDRAEAVVEAAPASAPVPRELNKGVVATHYLQPGDVLLIEAITAVDEVRIPSDQTILVDGSVDLGGFGRVVLAGLAIESAELLIEQTVFERLPAKSTLEQDDIDVNVRLIEPMHRYYVLGEVNSPGAYSLRGFETVLDGILEAGGLTNNASNCQMVLSRPTQPCSCRVTLPICYREIVQLGDTTTNYQLRPGDRIYVTTRGCCEEMKFWKANESCEKCDRCQKVCCNPAMAFTGNPMGAVVAMPIPQGSLQLHGGDAVMVDSNVTGVVGNPVGVTGGMNDGTLPAPAADGATLEPTFPELMQPPSGFDLQTPGVDVPSGDVPGAAPAVGDGELDGELDLDIVPKQSRRFQPMWLK